MQLSGKKTTTRPERVEGIRVGKKMQRLHVLQGAQFGRQAEGTVIGHYLVHYADGATQRIPIACGQDLLTQLKKVQDCTAICAVSTSRISPTMITSGSWRSAALRPAAKSSPTWRLTWGTTTCCAT